MMEIHCCGCKFLPFADLKSGKHESLQKQLTEVQQKLNKYLITEEAAMENRIRQFEEEERDRYSELQKIAKREKNAIVRLLLSAEDEDMRSSLSEAMNDTPPSPISPDLDGSRELLTSSDQSETASPSLNSSFNGQSNRHKMQTQMSLPASRREHNNHYGMDETDDALFDLDGFDDGGSRPYYDESDDDNDDTDDSSLEDRERLRGDMKAFYSTSVPISVPNWNNNLPHPMLNDDDDLELPRDAEQMAASIQALARSVHGDGTEMFGELPRSSRKTSFRRN